MILKGKFICFEKEFYGIFLIAFERKAENTLNDIVVAAGRSSFISTYSVEAQADKIMNTIQELIDDEEASIEMSKEIRSLLESRIDMLLEKLHSGITEIDNIFKELFQSYIKAEVEVSFSLEKSDHFKMVDVEREKEEQDKKAEEAEMRLQYKIPSNTTLVDCFIVLSPIKGKFIKEIQENELVLCKLDDSTTLGKSIAENYKLYGENQRLKPSIGKVYKKFYENNEVVMILRLTNDLMAIAREDEAVKVSVVEANKIVSKREVQEKKVKREERQEQIIENKREQTQNEMLIYLSAGVFVVVVALLLLFAF